MRIGRLHLLAAVFAAALLAGCGGGGGADGPRSDIQKVTVAGDSLADVGTFGLKFTVQNSADPAAGFPIFPEIVAQDFGVEGQCNYFTASATTNAGCTNFAVGGGSIYSANSTTDIRDVPTQLAIAAQVNGGYTARDLVIVDGGGNDAADLTRKYLAASADAAGFQAFLLQLLTPEELAGAGTPEAAAGLYMQKLADRYYGAIDASVLDQGATHVAVLDMPDITLTPLFQMVLASAGAQAPALQALIRQWITAFNTRLEADIGGDARVALVPFYADFNDEIANAVEYGLTNATQAACPVTGVDGAGLPTYSFPTCTSAALDAAPPTGLAAGWWQSWAFSDGFHPTPFGHRLLAASVSRAIARAGWL